MLGFLAEGPGAQLFMFLMGTSITLGKRKTTDNIIRRSSRLLIQGLLLNIVRLVIPYEIGLIPEKLLEDACLARSDNRIYKLLLTGDILQCAAISYMTAAVIYHRRRYAGLSLILALATALSSPKIWDRNSPYFLLSCFSKLCGGKPPDAFFPVFPWLTYTLAGLAWGNYLKTVPAGKLYPGTTLAGLLLLALGR